MRRALTVLLVLVWGVNGLWCKVLGQVPRHEQIVARVVGEALAPALTTLIGLAELGMVVWILSGLFPRLCAHADGDRDDHERPRAAHRWRPASVRAL